MTEDRKIKIAESFLRMKISLKQIFCNHKWQEEAVTYQECAACRLILHKAIPIFHKVTHFTCHVCSKTIEEWDIRIDYDKNGNKIGKIGEKK